MTIQIKIPTGLRRFVGNISEFNVEAETVNDALFELAKEHPGFARKTMSEDGKLKSFVRVFVNTKAVRAQDFEQAKLNNGDQIALMTAIAGG